MFPRTRNTAKEETPTKPNGGYLSRTYKTRPWRVKLMDPKLTRVAHDHRTGPCDIATWIPGESWRSKHKRGQRCTREPRWELDAWRYSCGCCEWWEPTCRQARAHWRNALAHLRGQDVLYDDFVFWAKRDEAAPPFVATDIRDWVEKVEARRLPA